MKLELNNISKTYHTGKSSITANDGISLIIESDSYLGVFGSNGSGKTTLIRTLMGIIEPDSGTISIKDRTGNTYKSMPKSLVGYMPQQFPGALHTLKVSEIIDIISGLKKLNKHDARLQISESLEYFNIDANILNSLCFNLSGGQRRILAFSLALLSNPELLILDEPTNDLDPHNRFLLWNKIDTMHMNGTGIILVTHSLNEVHNRISQYVLINSGKIISNSTSHDIKALINEKEKLTLYINESTNIDAIRKYLNTIRTNIINETNEHLIIYVNKQDSNNLLNGLQSFELTGYKKDIITLEDICFV